MATPPDTSAYAGWLDGNSDALTFSATSRTRGPARPARAYADEAIDVDPLNPGRCGRRHVRVVCGRFATAVVDRFGSPKRPGAGRLTC